MNAFIYLGPELGKKQDAVDSVRKKFSNAEEYVFYAGETAVSVIADTLQNHSLFAESRIIIIKNAEAIKKKDDIELLASCIKNIEENTVLILLSDENRLAAGLEDAVPKTNKQVFYELFEREKTEWLRQFFRREGFNIDNDCIDTILEMVENNTAALKRECSRLIYFLHRQELSKNRPVKPEDIEKWLSHNREESPFTLFSRIAAGDFSKALESLAVMSGAKESAQGILAGLAWQFRKLRSYLSLLERGETNNYAELKKLGLSAPKVKDDFAAAARRYNADAVDACLALTAEYDMLLRSPVAALENILMDRYILAIINISAA
ncbi:MAG: DNA polymerase III subunit delta [Treponema sp.]|jgi:DNA polymerase-3 subunit delta|nr:DNA polymerase III subunit delta [Treponema sp.]